MLQNQKLMTKSKEIIEWSDILLEIIWGVWKF
jgi:hypothetical protein